MFMTDAELAKEAERLRRAVSRWGEEEAFRKLSERVANVGFDRYAGEEKLGEVYRAIIAIYDAMS